MRIFKWIGIVLAGLLGAAAAGSFYLISSAKARFASLHELEVDDLPMPFPLSESELTELRQQRAADPNLAPGADPLAGLDLTAIARERALVRGRHYLESRAGCAECHGANFGGKVIVENPALGKWVGPNITRGGVTKDYTGKDWVRIVRHGIQHDGTAAVMPAIDFTWFSDQEISDIATYISSLPPISEPAPAASMGPIFALLIAKGDFPVSAEVIDHTAPRAKYAPPIVANLELGKHLATTCSGCHGEHFGGGPILGGDPSWPAAKNLTFHETGLSAWSLADFAKAMREGVRPDGTAVRPPMPLSLTKNFDPVEVESIYMYLKAQPPRAFGMH
jgi:mono/diheme cytochrome c family protein